MIENSSGVPWFASRPTATQPHNTPHSAFDRSPAVDQESREERLKADRELLAALQSASSIFTCEPSGEPPDRYTLTFRGKGLGRDASAVSDVVTIELHQIDLRMPYSYPNSPPDIRWLTPIWHPNVS